MAIPIKGYTFAPSNRKKVMLEIQGKYCKDLKVFTDNIEEVAVSTLHRVADMKPYAGKKIRIMPDVHQGVGDSVIGFSCPINLDGDFVSPAVVGCDLGCTISATFYDKPLNEEQIKLLEHRIRRILPFGKEINDRSVIKEEELVRAFSSVMNRMCSTYPMLKDHAIEFNSWKDLRKWCDKFHMDYSRFIKGISSVGGGNHFVEYDTNEELGKYCICVHCGSRNLGQKVFQYWNRIAEECKIGKEEMKSLVESVKASNTDKSTLNDELKEAKEQLLSTKVKGFLSDENMYKYLVDVLLAQEYARLNHQYIHSRIEREYCKLTGAKACEFISTTHNYIDYDLEHGNPMIRKGAIRSYKDELMIIPFNMRDGIAICEGKSNEDWNCTAPHGCGRTMSRKKAKELLNVDDFKADMDDAGVYTTTADETTLDEAPAAYKPKEEIIELIKDTCDVLYFMKPRMNIKSSE